MKKVLRCVFCGIGLVSMFFAGCQNSAESKVNLKELYKTTESSEPIVILLSHAEVEDSYTHRIAELFKEQLETLSNGDFFVDIYPDNALSSFSDTTEALEKGNIQIRIGVIESELFSLLVYPDLSGVGLEELMQSANEEPLKSSLEEESLEKGIRYMGCFTPSYAVLSSNREIQTIEDFSELRIRAMDLPIMKSFWENLNAKVVTYSASEAYSALAQSFVDASGQNPLHILVSRKLHEHQNYIIHTKHLIYVEPIYISEVFYQSLTDQQREWLQEAVQMTLEAEKELFRKEYEKNIRTLEDEGTEQIWLRDEVRQEIHRLVYPQMLEIYEDKYGVGKVEELLIKVKEEN